SGRDRDFLNDLPPFREAPKMPERTLIGTKQTGHSGRVAHPQGPLPAIANNVGKVRFVFGFSGIQRRERLRLWFKADDAAQLLFQHGLVRWLAVNRVGPNIDDRSRTLRAQELEQRVGRSIHPVNYLIQPLRVANGSVTKQSEEIRLLE